MTDDATLLAQADGCFRQGDIRGAYDRARLVLRRDRGNAAAHWQIARIAIEQGSYADAIRLCEIAVALAPCEPAYHAQLAYALVLTGRIVAARTAAAAALALPDASAETLDLIGAVFHAVCDFTSGAVALRRAVAIEPDAPALLANLGAMLTICGDIPAARDAFRRAIVVAPTMARPYGALSEIRAATPDDNNIAALQTLLRTTGDPRTGIILSHALAREQEALGEHDRAFATLDAGKRALAAVLTPDPHIDTAMFAALTRVLERDDARPGHAGPSPIFVVGMPRSGTTVVERILTNGDGVESIGESREFARLVAMATGTSARRFVDAGVLEARWPVLDLAAIGRGYVDHAAALLPNASRHVDKMPLNLLLADVIVRALPDARIVCTVRDPRDIVVGNYRQMFEFDTGTYDYSLSLAETAWYVAQATVWARRLERRHPKNVHVVDLERLIADPAGEARRIVDFCQLAWQPDCVAIERNRTPIGTASAVQARERIHPRHVGRWRQYAQHMKEASTVLYAAGVLNEEDHADIRIKH